jgi:7-cyano-7-deazaguanine reductase
MKTCETHLRNLRHLRFQFEVQMPTKKTMKASLPNPLPQFVVTRPTGHLDTFVSPRPGRAFMVTFETEEFTCLCPLTGQPDFAKLRILYQPDQLCVESKSLKLYLWSFRDQGAFHEAVTNQILDDLVDAHRGRLPHPRRHPHLGGGGTREEEMSPQIPQMTQIKTCSFHLCESVKSVDKK